MAGVVPSLTLLKKKPKEEENSAPTATKSPRKEKESTSPRKQKSKTPRERVKRAEESPRSTEEDPKAKSATIDFRFLGRRGKRKALSERDDTTSVSSNRKSFDSGSRSKQNEIKDESDRPVNARLVAAQRESRLTRKGSIILDSLSLEEGKGSPISAKKKKKKKKEGKKSKPVHHYFVLRVEEAKGLRKGATPLLGHINPYCTFDIIPSGIISAKTSVVKWEANPVWHDQFVGNRYFGLDGKPKPESFVISVMDKNSLSSDDLLGTATIPFTHSFDKWFPLQGERAQGELRVVLRFYSSVEGSKLHSIFKQEPDFDALCARWEKEVTELQDSYFVAEASEEFESQSEKEKGKGKEEATPVRIPPLDVPCFISVNKIWTLFQLAVFKDKPELVKHLYDLGCNINARDQTGNTALHIAAAKKLTGQMRNLLRLGVDAKAQNYLGGKDYKEMMAMYPDDDDDLGSYLL